jgi:hypothetical protein
MKGIGLKSATFREIQAFLMDKPELLEKPGKKASK